MNNNLMKFTDNGEKLILTHKLEFWKKFVSRDTKTYVE